jgi:hypothetical protein|tara:strand:+ start:496 stop:717 length:222 start_codon:yes stop_codon:yes gene_type:complete
MSAERKATTPPLLRSGGGVLAIRLFLGGFSAVIAQFVCHPIETVKVRLQVCHLCLTYHTTPATHATRTRRGCN